MSSSRWCCAFAALFLAAGCGGTTGGGGGGDDADADDAGGADRGRADTSGQDTGADTAQPVDLGPGDVAVDTGPVDTGSTEEPDASPELGPECGGLNQPCCSGGSCNSADLVCLYERCQPASDCPGFSACPTPEPGEPDVPVATRTGDPPSLAGGEILSGTYEMSSVELFPEGSEPTFLAGVVTSVDVRSNGNTFGSLVFNGADYGFDAQLDLYIGIGTIVGDFEQFFSQQIFAGGCYTISSNELVSDLTACGGVWPEGSTPPDSLEYESTPETGEIQQLLILTRETILASVPPEDQTMAGLAIVGDLPVLFTFEPME
jgi:hypothetical protein